MAENDHQELVVIKRRGLYEQAHHGGAWKIAFADFMTAMMALFLVLWLISSTSDKTKHAVAQYFNPVKLVDVTTLKKGFRDPKKTELGAGPKQTASTEDADSNQDLAETREVVERRGAKVRALTDAAMFKDPYSALAEVAAAVKVAPHAASGEQGQTSVGAMDASDVFEDPFTTIPRVAKSSVKAQASSRQSESPVASGSNVAAEGAASAIEKSEAPNQEPIRLADAQHKVPVGKGTQKDGDLEVARLKAEIDKAVKSETQAGPRVEVKATSEGFLISLTDDRNFSMFRIGSAVPEPETVQIMGAIGGMLKARTEAIVIRGYTDGRPFKSSDYDNWRLSAARAQMAHYMFVRGGLDEMRLERIEAYADRRLKVPSDPLAPANRRIEILLREKR